MQTICEFELRATPSMSPPKRGRVTPSVSPPKGENESEGAYKVENHTLCVSSLMGCYALFIFSPLDGENKRGGAHEGRITHFVSPPLGGEMKRGSKGFRNEKHCNVRKTQSCLMGFLTKNRGIYGRVSLDNQRYGDRAKQNLLKGPPY